MTTAHPREAPEGEWSLILRDPSLPAHWGKPFEDWVGGAGTDLRLEAWRQAGGDSETLIVWAYPSWGQLSWQAGCWGAGVGENIDPAWPPDWWWDGERWRRWATAAGEGGYLYLVDGKTPVVAAGPYVPTRFGKPDPWSEALREQKAGSAIPPDGQGIVAALQYVKKRWEPDVAVIIPRHDGAEEAWLHRGAQSGGALVVSALRWQTKVSAQRGKDLAGRETRRGAFVADPEAVEGRRVVLVDDIVVSGVTMVDAARAVTEAGAAEVVGVCGGWTIEGRAGGRAHVLRADAPER